LIALDAPSTSLVRTIGIATGASRLSQIGHFYTSDG
jgi:hypothetical protein